MTRTRRVLTVGLTTVALGFASFAPGVTPSAQAITWPWCYNSTATISLGSRGEAVKDAQCLLKDKGFNPGATDGIFGPNTRNAVINFQRSRGLVADGIVGPHTWSRLKR